MFVNFRSILRVAARRLRFAGTLAAALLIAQHAAAATASDLQPVISAFGGWALIISPNDLSNGPGSDLQPIDDSDSDQMQLTIALAPLSKTGGGPHYPVAWRVDVRRSDFDWPEALSILLRRTSSGTAPKGSDVATLSGGLTYMPVGTEDSTLFTGSGTAQDVDIQVRLSGMSIKVPPGTYSTNLIFTVVQR